jgi:LytR cell envelope-related transcriptional attenuator
MGRHEPPTNRSFYLSMGASTLRFALIVALVVGGIVLINQAFPDGTPDASGSPPDDGVVATDSPSPTTPPPDDGDDTPTPSPTVEGVRIAVFNGAGVTGLAADTLAQLIDEYGYEAGQEADDAPSQVPVTTVFYRSPSDRVEAEYLANEFFRRLDEVVVARLDRSADVDPSVQVAIYLGTDYAATLN